MASLFVFLPAVKTALTFMMAQDIACVDWVGCLFGREDVRTL